KQCISEAVLDVVASQLAIQKEHAAVGNVDRRFDIVMAAGVVRVWPVFFRIGGTDQRPQNGLSRAVIFLAVRAQRGIDVFVYQLLADIWKNADDPADMVAVR